MKISALIEKTSPRILLLLCALFSFCALSAALIGQYGFDLHPCDLCIYQRIPYAAIVIIGLIGGIFAKSRRIAYFLAAACCLLFLADAGIAAYHTGVETGVFKGPSACSSDGKVGQTLEEIRAAIMNAPLVTCAQAMAYFMGLSMAAWNLIAASLAFLGTAFILVKIRKN